MTNETLGTNCTFLFLLLVCFSGRLGPSEKTATDETIRHFKCCAKLTEPLEQGGYFLQKGSILPKNHR